MQHIFEKITEIKNQKLEPICLYLYDLFALKAHITRLKQEMPAYCRLYYAVKANAHPNILTALNPLVDGFEVASLGEIQKVRNINKNTPIIFGGPGKTNEELNAALSFGVERIHVESIHEINRLAYLSQNNPVSILVRVNLRESLPKARLAMAGCPTQFGIDETEVQDALQLIKHYPNLKLAGFHFHSMSNNIDANAHFSFVKLCLDKSEQFSKQADVPLTLVNVGGGIGIDYQKPENQFDWNGLVVQIKNNFSNKSPMIQFECGRFLTADCGYYVVEVLDIKRNHGKTFAIIRGGSHHFRLPAAWKHNHPFKVLAYNNWNYPYPRPSLQDEKVTIAGELCTPNDILAQDIFLPSLRVGDLLVFQLAGAYGWDISHHDFLSHPYPEEVFIND